MKRAALFDLDGVIVDTEPSYTKFWAEIGQEFFPGNPNFALNIKGHTLTYILERYFPDDSLRQQQVVRRLQEHQKTMKYPFIPGVTDFIHSLRKLQVGVAVVTSSDQQKMASLYAEHPDFITLFDRIFTSEDALRSKPAPDCYLTAARFFRLPPEQCVVFEDSFNGLEAGRASGAKVVGLSTSNSASAISGFCDLVVPDFRATDLLIPLFE